MNRRLDDNRLSRWLGRTLVSRCTICYLGPGQIGRRMSTEGWVSKFWPLPFPDPGPLSIDLGRRITNTDFKSRRTQIESKTMANLVTL